MERKTLKERLFRYLLKNHGWIASGDLQKIVAEYTSYTPQTVGRELRRLKNEGKIRVQYRTNNGIRHAFYAAVNEAGMTREEMIQNGKEMVKMFDALPNKNT